MWSEASVLLSVYKYLYVCPSKLRLFSPLFFLTKYGSLWYLCHYSTCLSKHELQHCTCTGCVRKKYTENPSLKDSFIVDSKFQYNHHDNQSYDVIPVMSRLWWHHNFNITSIITNDCSSMGDIKQYILEFLVVSYFSIHFSDAPCILTFTETDNFTISDSFH